jgi:hypothetical protein
MTATQIIKRLWELNCQQIQKWDSDRYQEQRSLENLALGLPGWEGRQSRSFLVPGVPNQGIVFSTYPKGLVHAFFVLEHPHDLDLANDCTRCGAVLPAVSDASCYSCNTQAVS